MRISTDVEIPPYLRLQITGRRLLDNGDKLDDVRVDTYHRAGADAEEVDARLRAGLHTEAQVRLECRGPRDHCHGKRLTVQPLADLIRS